MGTQPNPEQASPETRSLGTGTRTRAGVSLRLQCATPSTMQRGQLVNSQPQLLRPRNALRTMNARIAMPFATIVTRALVDQAVQRMPTAKGTWFAKVRISANNLAVLSSLTSLSRPRAALDVPPETQSRVSR